MKFLLEKFDLPEIKKALVPLVPQATGSAHRSEAIARGFGYSTSRHMHDDFDSTLDLILRPIREDSFIKRLDELSGVKVAGEPLKAALMRSLPAGLVGDDPGEKLIVAVANALGEERMDPRDGESAFSLWVAEMDGGDYDVMLEFRERDGLTVIKSGEDDKTVAGLRVGDFDAIKRMLGMRRQTED